MSLNDRLEAMKRAAEDRIPEDQRAVMARATQELRDSGLAERAVGVGDQAPVFELPNARGELVNSAELVAAGPLAVSFFRGKW